MTKEIKDLLEALNLFYLDKARQPENSDKSTFYTAYAAGIKRAVTEIQKREELNAREVL